MKLLLALLVLVVAVSASGGDGVDEDLLVPHALDASETSDREILESLNEDEETTESTTLATTEATTTTTTTTTTTPKPTTPEPAPEPTYSPATEGLLETLKFDTKKMLRAGVDEMRAKMMAKAYLKKRALRKAREEEEEALHHREEERHELEEERERARKLAEKKRKEDYVPKSLKKVMTTFGLNWRKAEMQHESIPQIKADIQRRAAEEEHRIEEEEKTQASEAANEIAHEMEVGMQGPLAEEKRVEKLQEQEALKVLAVRKSAHHHADRVIDAVRRRQRRLKEHLISTEKHIIEKARHDEQEAVQQAQQTAIRLRAFARDDILKSEHHVISVANKAARMGSAAAHWLQDQEIPAINSFIGKEKSKLRARLADIETKARYRKLRLKEQLEGKL